MTVIKGRYVSGDNGLRTIKTDAEGRLEVDAVVKIDSMSLEAEMKVDSGHDLYEATTVTRTGDLAVSFDSVAGLTLSDVQSMENKTQGWIYNTKGATVSATGITLVAGNQKTGYPVIAVADEVELVYRGTSRLTNKTQMAQITDGTNEATILIQDSAFGTTSKGLPLFGKYEATPTTYTDGDATPILLDANGRIVLSSDIGIGAVELKDGDTDNRSNIKAADTARTTGTLVIATQNIGADGTVNPTGSLNTNAPFTKLTDGTSDLILGTGTTKTVPTELNDGTTKIIFGTGTTKNVPVGLNDGTTAITFGTGTVKTIPCEINDGTNGVGVIATINSIKSDLSSVAGTVTNVNGGNRDVGTQTVTLADDDPLVLAQAIPTTIGQGTKDVTTAGVAEALGSSTSCKSIYIRAKSTNTDAVYIGGSGVSSADGIALYANDTCELKISNIATVYVDSAVNGEGVGFTYVD